LWRISAAVSNLKPLEHEQCRSVYLWQGDLAEFKERDTKKWVEYLGWKDEL
jgi:hypothetical protein